MIKDNQENWKINNFVKPKHVTLILQRPCTCIYYFFLILDQNDLNPESKFVVSKNAPIKPFLHIFNYFDSTLCVQENTLQ